MAAEVGAKSPTSSGELTPEEEALVATNFVQEAPLDNAAYEGQQLRLEASSDGSHVGLTARGHSKQDSGRECEQDTEQLHVPSSFSRSPPYPVPTHSYRHDRVQHDSTTNRTAASIGSAAAKLQPA